MNLSDVRRERAAARRRILAVITERRLARQAEPTGTRLFQASISRTDRIPTDS